MILERPEAVLSGYSLFHLDETQTSSVDADYNDSFFFSASGYPQFYQLVPYRTFDFIQAQAIQMPEAQYFYLLMCCELFREW